MNLEQLFKEANQAQKLLNAQKKTSPQKNKPPSPKKKKLKVGQCAVCGVIGQLMNNVNHNYITCAACGATQGQVALNNSPMQGNKNVPKVKYAKQITADPNVKVKYLVNRFNNLVTHGQSEIEAISDEVMGIYSNIQKQRGKLFRGFKMPEVVLAILYCVYVKHNQALNLGMMVNIMNKIIDESLKDVQKCQLKKVEDLRKKKKVGISNYFKSTYRVNCFSLDPSEFVSRPLFYFGINKKDPLHNKLKSLSIEIFNEYSNMSKSPSEIGTACVYYGLKKIGLNIDHTILGVHKNTLNSVETKINESKNPKVIALRNSL